MHISWHMCGFCPHMSQRGSVTINPSAADEDRASVRQHAARGRQVVERELEEAVTLPVYGSQAALVRARDKTTLGKLALLPGAAAALPK